ncbi:glycosyltransferase family 4 protein [cf. Phormidesmis sp. LEGE 11477]|uniref:glycosyltransferase family 4 protein n=1 Tax=cf. Phormidesmis sp. LEGE 11477 TaxID=1828680 RepID=UPI00187FC1FF|nr:glycosyltransferase family 4 protein [cf. Phormidesmis sp. LEGE 11477]MBE9063609.1 glycosyltransferase family 4 protein [cf. Phormidesmis sp. LEGE 11477]
MNVLHINQSDIAGGAAIAAHRLHKALLSQDVQSKLLVDRQQSDSSLVASIPRRRYLDSLSSRVAYYVGLNYVNHTSTFNIPSHPFYIEADVLNFHNVHGDYFNYLALPKLTRQKPAVLTLHDMWSFTGHCAYSFECKRWRTGCGKCPAIATYPKAARDSTTIEWKLKKWTFTRSNLVVVSPSYWLSKLAKESIIRKLQIRTIPNGLDTQAFQPLDRDLCRRSLGISTGKKILLFAAQNLNDPRKGGDLLLSAIQQLPRSLIENLVLLVLGESSDSLFSSTGIPVISLGYVGGSRVKAIAYSAADAFIFPTRADNLPLVLQESMACGTPMISFNTGGVPELVRPGVTGLLAKPEDATELSSKIVELLEDTSLRQRMSLHCRAIAIDEYSIELQAKRYKALYAELIEDRDAV